MLVERSKNKEKRKTSDKMDKGKEEGVPFRFLPFLQLAHDDMTKLHDS